MSALEHTRRISAAMSSVAASEDSHPSRCESPLLPMGQIDPDRLSQQLDTPRHRQSQHSISYKNYALRDDEALEESPDEPNTSSRAKRTFRKYPTALGSWSRRPTDPVADRRTHRQHTRRPAALLRPKSYRIHAGEPQTSPVREFSSKIKSACKKLNPKRLARSAHHHEDTQDDVEDPARFDP
ncbi:hypothetical protein IW150_006917, partial [Coemansia sp. RSA 2607]